jgi:nicotinamidase/pyrazinamidase
MRTALLLLNLQIDFLSGGAVPESDTEALVQLANEMMPRFDRVVAIQEWHPANHISFAAVHPWRKPGQLIAWQGEQQLLWPMHCVQQSFGAEFAPGLNLQGIHHIIRTGTQADADQQSAFRDRAGRSSGLEDYLRAEGIGHLQILGVPREYCLEPTRREAVALGFGVG